MKILYAILFVLMLPVPADAKDFKISGELAQKIANYLSTKPYREVHKLIGPLLKLPEIKPKKPEKKKR